MSSTNTRWVWMDNLRVIATIAVIIVHVATPAVFTKYDPNSATNTEWWIGNVYDSICRFCVPVFVMLTGALLLPQKLSLADFLKKRLNRILMPFVFWSIIYIAFNLALKVRDEGSTHALTNIGPWLWLQVTQGAAPHLWYIYMIVGVYLFIPVIQPFAVAAGNKTILYFLGIWLVTIIFHQQKLITINSPFDLSYFSGYIGYLVLGYFIAERVNISPAIFKGSIALFVAGCGITLIGTYVITYEKGAFLHDFYEYLTLNVLLAATGIFIIFKHLSQTSSGAFGHVGALISKYGYGIYLSHLMVISVLAHFNIDYSLVTPAVGIILTSVICLVISAVLVFAINKLPYGKYVSG